MLTEIESRERIRKENNLKDLSKALEELRKDNASDLRESYLFAVSSANQIWLETGKTLFSVSALIIAIFAAVLGLKEVKEALDVSARVFIGHSLILLLLSMISGFLHMLAETNFFVERSKNIAKQYRIWSSTSFWPSDPNRMVESIDEYNKMKQKTDTLESSLDPKSTDFFLYLQGIFGATAFLGILIVIFKILSV
ncbi:hypothetical protein HY405_00835 [Candidatus Microgenomates bacterium]|nr:hypothetical protein [Candidatus Microgenomates bacterium]